MRILLIGHNDASNMNNTIKLLRKDNVEAIGMAFFWSSICDYSHILAYKKWQFISYYLMFLYQLIRCDVVHFWGVQVPLIIGLTKLFNKPHCVEWMGGDVRQCHNTQGSEYVTGNKEQSLKNQKPFADCINITSSQIMSEHIVAENVRYIPHRLDISEFSYSNKFIIGHCPTNREAKGTHFVEKAVSELKGKGYNVELLLIENVEHNECLRLMKQCDIFCDQFVWNDFGLASIEASAMGKIVLCDTGKLTNTPTLNCRGADLADMIETIINLPADSIKCISETAREWVMNNCSNVSHLINIYNEVLELNINPLMDGVNNQYE